MPPAARDASSPATSDARTQSAAEAGSIIVCFPSSSFHRRNDDRSAG
jgi:hypothetical protein